MFISFWQDLFNSYWTDFSLCGKSGQSNLHLWVVLLNHEFVLHNFLHVELPRKNKNKPMWNDWISLINENRMALAHNVLSNELPLVLKLQVISYCYQQLSILLRVQEFSWKQRTNIITLVRNTSFERNSWCKCFKSCSYWVSLLEGIEHSTHAKGMIMGSCIRFGSLSTIFDSFQFVFSNF